MWHFQGHFRLIEARMASMSRPERKRLFYTFSPEKIDHERKTKMKKQNLKKTTIFATVALMTALLLPAYPANAADAGSYTLDLTKKDSDGNYSVTIDDGATAGKVNTAVKAADESGQIKGTDSEELKAYFKDLATAFGGSYDPNGGYLKTLDLDKNGTYDLLYIGGEIGSEDLGYSSIAIITVTNTCSLKGDWTLTLSDASKAKAAGDYYSTIVFKLPQTAATAPTTPAKTDPDGKTTTTPAKTDSDGKTATTPATTTTTQAGQSQQDPTLIVKASKTRIKRSTKKNQKIRLTVKTNSKGKVTYSVAGNAKKLKKYIKVSKKGVVTIKKNAPKGTYKVQVKIAKNGNYNAASKIIKIKVKK